MGELSTNLVVGMDEGSAHVVASHIRSQISCGDHVAAELDPTNPIVKLFPSISPWVILCMELVKTVDDSKGKVTPHQCVVLTGNVDACPFLKRCDKKAMKKKLGELRREAGAALTYSSVGNYHTVYGSEWDKS